MATFKTLKIIKFDNIAVKGEYEYKEKPWIITFLVLPIGWLWEGLRYSYDHNPRQFTFGKTTSFQVEFYAQVPEEVGKMDDQRAKKFVEGEFKKIAKKFSEIKNFQSDDLFTFKPATSIK